MSVVTQTKVASPFTAVPPVYTAAASAAAGAAETFTIKPDCDDIREVILVRNGSTDKTVTVYFECNENAPRPTTAFHSLPFRLRIRRCPAVRFPSHHWGCGRRRCIKADGSVGGGFPPPTASKEALKGEWI